jgi:succinyl-CoA synthetase alpha subunit
MYEEGEPGFNYFVGIGSLEEVATRDDRVCVLNILGNESRSVTPVSHAWSGGNVVFGTGPGRAGRVLETPAGDIPVFDNVRDGLEAGHPFNTGVVYLPPAAVRHGVYELVRVNPELEKIVIVTEKVPVHDARLIRAVTQQLGVNVFGANCLGVADAWNRVRIGGALGGDTPGEALHRGSVAVYSNSGNFTTTIASYLAMAGWGTTTLVSSGKDHYIHYASPEWAYAFDRDPRSEAAVMYIEPGGDYERGLAFAKPVVACVVGKWKERLSRPVGHAGAVSGSGTSAEDKERWMMESLAVDGIFTPERPVISKKGAVVTNIAHIPEALTAVMAENGVEPDFEPRGSLSLKPWFGNAQGLDLPEALQVPVVEAIDPYAEQIAELNRQVGTVFPRTGMKDASGASRMDPESQVTALHGVPVLELGTRSFVSTLALALLRSEPDPRCDALTTVAVAASAHLHGDPALVAAEAARAAGSSPPVVLGAAAAVVGPARVDRCRDATDVFIDLLARLEVEDPWGELSDAAMDEALDPDPFAESGRAEGRGADAGPGDAAPRTSWGRRMVEAVEVRGAAPLPLEILRRLDRDDDEELVLAALAVTLAWPALHARRISRVTARNLPWFLRLYGTLLGVSVPASAHGPGRLMGVDAEAWLARRPLEDLAYRALVGTDPDQAGRASLRMLLGLLVSNGPGTITAQGAKGSVSADGPESPERVQIQKAVMGFLTHSGFSHGGNGYEGIRFLMDVFEESGLEDPGAADPPVDLEARARAFVEAYAGEKARARAVGAPVRMIPGINHPVYRGKPVNVDPREVWVREHFEARGEHNVFHRFYRTLVRTLADEGVTPNVFAVNIDAVISTQLLKLMWARYRDGELEERRMEESAFLLFLFGRMIGCAAEIDDHLNRGRNMDTRTPQSACRAVS